jgi:metallo-beta-lactamase class B
MTIPKILLLLITTPFLSCGRNVTSFDAERVVLADDLAIMPLADDTWLHITQLRISDGNVFPCNGMIYIDDGEALILDGPLNDSLAALLIEYVERELDATVIGLVVDHFHEDGAGGIDEFHRRGIPTYSSAQTCRESAKRGEPCATIRFDDTLAIAVGDERVVCGYYGRSHAPDNIVTYIADRKLLFGGCMIKEMGAGKGNLADADTAAWSGTVRRVRAAYPDATIVVPGHGAPGGPELFDYTIEMFGGKGEGRKE